jgi:hypothetical protein
MKSAPAEPTTFGPSAEFDVYYGCGKAPALLEFMP